MTTWQPIATAIAHIRRITPSNDPWTAKDIAYEEQAPDEVDDSIATILNAVVAGRLILARPEIGAAAPDLLELTATLTDALEVERAEVERLTKGSICEVAATNPSVMEYMSHWEGRAEKAETKLDQSRELLVVCIRGNTKLKEKASKARLEGWRAGRDAAAEEAERYDCSEGGDDFTAGVQSGYRDAVQQIVEGIRALPEPKEVNHDCPPDH